MDLVWKTTTEGNLSPASIRSAYSATVVSFIAARLWVPASVTICDSRSRVNLAFP